MSKCAHDSVVTQRSVPRTSVCDSCGEQVQRVWVSASEAVIPIRDLEAVDQQARAYGWEIGRLKPPVPTTVAQTHPDNPFLDPNWRARLEE